MEKRFIFTYKRANSDVELRREIKFVVDDLADCGTWFPQLFVKLDAFRIRHDRTNRYHLTELKCWDMNLSLYQDSAKAPTSGVLLKYVRKNANEPGQWYGQYPANAYCCHGLFIERIGDMCDQLRHKPDSQLINGGGGFISDIIAMTLFPDKVHTDSHKVQAIVKPKRDAAIRAVDDAINAFEFLERAIVENNINVPEQYLRCTNSLVNRLCEARLFIEQSALTSHR